MRATVSIEYSRGNWQHQVDYEHLVDSLTPNGKLIEQHAQYLIDVLAGRTKSVLYAVNELTLDSENETPEPTALPVSESESPKEEAPASKDPQELLAPASFDDLSLVSSESRRGRKKKEA
jgi:hypothetical protein